MFGKRKDVTRSALDVSDQAQLLSGSQEFMRVWAAADGPVTCFIDPRPIGPDPAALGIALVDCARHGAIAYAHAAGISEQAAYARIWEGFDAERLSPTDIATELPLKGDMN